MTRQLDQIQEERQARKYRALVKALEYDLEGSVGHAGGVLSGFSVRFGGYETLVTLRAVVAGRHQIAFVGSSSLVEALLKCVRLAKNDELKWRGDKYKS